MRLERDDEKLLVDTVKEAGGLCIKLNPTWYRGIPDRMVLLSGTRIFFLELKKAKANTNKRTRVHQSRWKGILRTLGFTCDTITGKEEMEEWIYENLN